MAVGIKVKEHQYKSLLAPAPGYTQVYGTIAAQTQKALLFKFDVSGKEVTSWFPISQIDFIYDSKEVDCDVINLADWILGRFMDTL